MAEKHNFELYQTQVSTNVSFTAFMTAVVVFFTGLLLSQFKSYDISIKIPISFLIISIFGFLYSTIVFANASEEVSNKNFKKFKDHMWLGDALGEYLGVYLLIVSIPLVINVITTDFYLRIVTIISALLGLTIYQFSGFSVMERHFSIDKHKFLSYLILFFGIILYLAQVYRFYFVFTSILFIILMLIITYFAVKNKEK